MFDSELLVDEVVELGSFATRNLQAYQLAFGLPQLEYKFKYKQIVNVLKIKIEFE